MFRAKQLESRVQQERAEQIEDPIKSFNQNGANADHHAAHHQRAEHSPEQQAMLVAWIDAEKLKELGFGSAEQGVTDGWVEAKVAERQAARQRRDFAKSDEIRKELAERGIIVEDSKDGSGRWKRK